MLKLLVSIAEVEICQFFLFRKCVKVKGNQMFIVLITELWAQVCLSNADSL